MSIPLAAMPGATLTSLPFGLTRRPTSLKPRRALLVLDCQEGFLRPSGPMPGTDEATALIARNIKKLLPSFRRSGGDVLWIKTEFKEARDSRTAEKSKINSDRQEKLGLLSADIYSDDGGSDTGIKTPISPGEPALTPAGAAQEADDDNATDDPDAFLGPRFAKENKGFLKPGSDSAAIVPELTKFIDAKDKKITKTCYSAFEEGNLVLALRSRMVTELYIAGANTNSSIFATVSDASRYGFNMWILSDCVSYTDKERHENALEMMRNNFALEELRTVELLIKVVEGRGEHAKEGAAKVVGEEMVKNPTMDQDILDQLVESLRSSENSPPAAEERRRSRPLSSQPSLADKLKALELDVDTDEDDDSSDDATEASNMLSLTESVETIRAKILKKSSSLSQLNKQPAKNAVELALEPRTARRFSSKSSRDALEEAAAKLSEAKEAVRARNRPDPADIGILKEEVPKEPDKKIRSPSDRTAPPKAASPTNDLPEMPPRSSRAPSQRMERKSIVIRRRTSVKKGESKQGNSAGTKKTSSTTTPPPVSEEAPSKRARPSEKESATKFRTPLKDNIATKEAESKRETPIRKEEVIKDITKDVPIVTIVSDKEDTEKVKTPEIVASKKTEKSPPSAPSKSDASHDTSTEQKKPPVDAAAKDGKDVAKNDKDSKDSSAATQNPGKARAENNAANAKPLEKAQNPATSKQHIMEDEQAQSSQTQPQSQTQTKSATQSKLQESITATSTMSESAQSEKVPSKDQSTEAPAATAKDSGRLTPVRKRKKNDIPDTFVGPGDAIGDPGDGSSIVVDLLPPELATDAFERLKEEVRWRVMYHRGGEVPRLVAVEGQICDDGSFPIYRHPADESPPLFPFSSTVQKIREHVEKQLGHPVNHVLIQYYRGGMDYISEHSDKTLDIVQGSYICNVSLGAQRVMTLRTKKAYVPHDEKHGSSGDKPAPASKEEPEIEERNIQRVKLVHNSLFVLGLETNKRWTHAIKQDRRPNSLKLEEELAYNGERISLTFRQIGTFLSKDETKIWGQGAKNKSKDKAGETVCGNEEKAQDMIYAFAAENGNPDFVWKETYGAGFDVLHFTPQMPKIYTLAAAGDDVNGGPRLHPSSLSLKIALAELDLHYREQALKMTDLSDKHFAEVSPRQRTPVFVDVDPSRTVVIGEQGILTYLASTTRPGNAQQASSPERYADLLPDPKKDQCEFGRVLSGFAELPGLLELTQKVNAFPLETQSKKLKIIDVELLEEVKAELKVWDKYFWKKVPAQGEKRRFTIFDCALVPLLAYLLDGIKGTVDVEEYKTLKGYLDDARKRESVRKVLGKAVFDFSQKAEKKVITPEESKVKEETKGEAKTAATSAPEKEEANITANSTPEKEKEEQPQETVARSKEDKAIEVKTVASVPDEKEEQQPQEDKAIEVKTVASSPPESNNSNDQTHEGDTSIATDDSTTDNEGGGVKLVL